MVTWTETSGDGCTLLYVSDDLRWQIKPSSRRDDGLLQWWLIDKKSDPLTAVAIGNVESMKALAEEFSR